MNILDPYRNGVKNKSISQICSWTGFLGFTKLSYIFTQIPAVWFNPLYLGLSFILKGLAIYPKFSLPVIIITTLNLRQKIHWAQILSYMHQHVL